MCLHVLNEVLCKILYTYFETCLYAELSNFHLDLWPYINHYINTNIQWKEHMTPSVVNTHGVNHAETKNNSLQHSDTSVKLYLRTSPLATMERSLTLYIDSTVSQIQKYLTTDSFSFHYFRATWETVKILSQASRENDLVNCFPKAKGWTKCFIIKHMLSIFKIINKRNLK